MRDAGPQASTKASTRDLTTHTGAKGVQDEKCRKNITTNTERLTIRGSGLLLANQAGSSTSPVAHNGLHQAICTSTKRYALGVHCNHVVADTDTIIGNVRTPDRNNHQRYHSLPRCLSTVSCLLQESRPRSLQIGSHRCRAGYYCWLYHESCYLGCHYLGLSAAAPL